MTEAVNWLQSLNKKLPPGEGTLCGQKKLGRSPRNRPQLVRSPSRNASARWHRSREKSRFLRNGYPDLQNICHIDVGRGGILERITAIVFDITQSSLRTKYLLRSVNLVWCVSPGRLPLCNKLISKVIMGLFSGLTLFPWRGLPTHTKSLFMCSTRVGPRVAVAC